MAGRRKRMALASEGQRAEWIEQHRYVWGCRSKRVRRRRRHPWPTVDLLPFFRAAFPQERIERMFFEHSPVLAAAGFYANKAEWLALRAKGSGFGGSILDALGPE